LARSANRLTPSASDAGDDADTVLHAMRTTEAASRIPRLPGVPLLGNLPQVAREKNIFEAFERFHQKLGPIFELELGGLTLVVVCDHAHAREVCDDARFDKSFEGPLLVLREIAGDGLFTARTEEPNWKLAHTLLVPAFGHRAMKAYLPAMVDVAQQLFARWDAMGPDAPVDVVADMTRMTLDTIALCAFDYRFHSMQRHDTHPFVDAMMTALVEVQARATRPALLTEMMLGTRRRLQRATRLMHDTVDDIIRERRAHPKPEARDLLNLMLDARDPTSGEGLSDENIRYQVVTFLIAGHETTSGTLAFALHHLLQNPAALQRAYDEVDRVLGGDIDRAPTFEQVNQLQYVSQILREAVRLNPAVSVLNRKALHDTTIGGRYHLKKDQVVLVALGLLHRDPAVWGEDAARFDPEHFSPEAEATRPQHAFKGFGTGRRACIGSQFAMIEATLVLGTLLQRYRLRGDPAYNLDIQVALTIKPSGFYVRLEKRTDADRKLPASEGPTNATPSPSERAPAEAPPPAVVGHGTPLCVLFGSNMGSAEEFAGQLADAGRMGGFAVTTAPLNAHAKPLPTQGAVLIVSSTYNGKAPDNAAEFCAWLDRDDHAANALAGVRYAVFGCGNRD
jgi:cytochrome P450 / NADPH-cytochrome P450 reductase